MPLSVRESALYLVNIKTRFPFRYGIATMTVLPHLFVRLEVEIDGQRQTGLAAENLVPKWFTKDPNISYQDEVAAMLRVIEAACDFAGQIKAAETPFELWQQLYATQQAWASTQNYPALLWNLGVSLVERAVIDAFCRAKQFPLHQALRANSLGIHLDQLHPELAGLQPADLLPLRPLRSIIVRHTVGLADPLTNEEIGRGEWLPDGLPQSLTASIEVYGLSYFKIKISGEPQQDRDRLKQIAAVLHQVLGWRCFFTLDGNEQYRDVAAFRAFWDTLTADPDLAHFLKRLLFVEQPFPREVALSPETTETLEGWTDRPPLIIDESDSLIENVRQALAGGYAGTSHKNCKGVFKGVANACLLEYHRRANPRGRYILSGEDLTTIGPVALLQDLAVMANLGLSHVERNGHHYFAGLSIFPHTLQAQMLAHHWDLYRRHPHGFVALDIHNGRLAVNSAIQAPFGLAFMLDPARFTPREAWKFVVSEEI